MTDALLILGTAVLTIAIFMLGAVFGFLMAAKTETRTVPKTIRNIQAKVEGMTRERTQYFPRLTPRERMDIEDEEMKAFKAGLAPAASDQHEL